MPRSTKKGPYVAESLLKKIQKAKRGDLDEVKTWSRASMIIPEMVGLTIRVHNGRYTYPFISSRIWWVTSWVSLHRPALFAPTAA